MSDVPRCVQRFEIVRKTLVAMHVNNDVAEFWFVETSAEDLLDSRTTETIVDYHGTVFRMAVSADGLVGTAVEILKHFVWHIPAWLVEGFNTPEGLTLSVAFGEAFKRENREIDVFGLLPPVADSFQPSIVESVLAPWGAMQVDENHEPVLLGPVKRPV